MPVSENITTVLDPARIVKVYSGKPGCMCGCNGRYWVNPAHRAEADEERGLAYDDGDMSERNVKRIVAILNSSPDTKIDKAVAYLDGNGRTYAAYLSSNA